MSYILCASPRTGSTLLCTLLEATRVAGNPDSYFNTRWMVDCAADWNVPVPLDPTDPATNRAYLDAVLAAGTGDTGMFGLRLMHKNLAALLTRLATLYPDLPDAPARFAAAFDSPRYIHLSRRDKLAQAVSYEIATQSGLWHRNPDGTEMERQGQPQTPHYDATRIKAQLDLYAREHRLWSQWFTAHNLTPLRVWYEDLAANPQAVLAQVLSHLGQNPALARHLPPGTAKLADATSADWMRRYLADPPPT